METAKGNFKFHEVEENEGDLVKLRRWYKKILKRDFFTCPTLNRAKQQLDHCEALMLEFTKKVYQLEGYSEGHILPDC